jgi:hypothetical protein
MLTRGMPTSGSRDMGSWPAASRPRVIAARVVRRTAVGRERRLVRMLPMIKLNNS